jgi:hypothetical protein
VVEAGFAASSPGVTTGVRRVASVVSKPIVLSLARTRQDIDRALKAVDEAKARNPRVHRHVGHPPRHEAHDEPAGRPRAAVWAVTRAKQHLDYVGFSTEDASPATSTA